MSREAQRTRSSRGPPLLSTVVGCRLRLIREPIPHVCTHCSVVLGLHNSFSVTVRAAGPRHAQSPTPQFSSFVSVPQVPSPFSPAPPCIVAGESPCHALGMAGGAAPTPPPPLSRLALNLRVPVGEGGLLQAIMADTPAWRADTALSACVSERAPFEIWPPLNEHWSP